MSAFYVISLFPILLVLRFDAQFSWRSAFFVMNWLGVSLSVYASAQLGLSLAELGITAEQNLAAIVLNLAIAWTLFVGAVTYRWLAIVGVRNSVSSATRASAYAGIDRVAFLILTAVTGLIAIVALGTSPPILSGTSVSEYFRSLNAIERFAFTSIAISSVGLSKYSLSLLRRRRIGPLGAGAMVLFPPILWACAGEKFGYFLFILFLAATPWIDIFVRSKRAKWFALLAIGVALLLTLMNYTLNTAEPFAFLVARFSMQGQLWHFFYEATPLITTVGTAIETLAGGAYGDTIRLLMELSMPSDLFVEYETALLTGSHFPAMLRASGWIGFPVLVTLIAVVFGVTISMLRMAIESSSLLLSYLLVGFFVFPSIEVFVSGNLVRLFTLPLTYAIFLLALLPLFMVHVRIRLCRPRRLFYRESNAH
jgi:hypothetical protein